MKKGFTLIELLVVISMVVVLTVIVVFALNPIQRIQESRDSRRKSDLQNVRSAIDIALTDNTLELTGTPASPVSGTSKADGIISDGTGWVKFNVLSGDGLSAQLVVLPDDPKGVNAPCNGYEFVSDGTYYELKTCFETTKYQADYTTDGGDEATHWEIGSKPGLTL